MAWFSQWQMRMSSDWPIRGRKWDVPSVTYHERQPKRKKKEWKKIRDRKPRERERKRCEGTNGKEWERARRPMAKMIMWWNWNGKAEEEKEEEEEEEEVKSRELKGCKKEEANDDSVCRRFQKEHREWEMSKGIGWLCHLVSARVKSWARWVGAWKKRDILGGLKKHKSLEGKGWVMIKQQIGLYVRTD